MTNNHIKYEVVKEIVDILSKKLKGDKSRAMSFNFGKNHTYDLRFDGDLFSVYADGICIQHDIALYESAVLILQLYAKNRIADMMDVVMADDDFIKYRNDAIIYKHVASTSTSFESREVAIDRMEIAVSRMKLIYQIFEEKRRANKLVKIDK